MPIQRTHRAGPQVLPTRRPLKAQVLDILCWSAAAALGAGMLVLSGYMAMLDADFGANVQPVEAQAGSDQLVAAYEAGQVDAMRSMLDTPVGVELAQACRAQRAAERVQP